MRRPEPAYHKSAYIYEFYNTLSNLPFIFIGLARLAESNNSNNITNKLYLAMVFCGVCSGIHHAVNFRGSIILDYIPIVYSLIYLTNMGLWYKINPISVGLATLALFILFLDHIVQLMPVPWGHVMWHVCAAYAMDSCYQSLKK
jgi:hypothetical protein